MKARLAKFGIRFAFNAVVGLVLLIFGMGYTQSRYTNGFSFANGFNNMVSFIGGLGSFWGWLVLAICTVFGVGVTVALYFAEYGNSKLKLSCHVAAIIILILGSAAAIYFLWEKTPSNVAWWALGFVAFIAIVTWLESLPFLERRRSTTTP